MTKSQLEAALDNIIKKFKEDSSKSTDYCPPESFDSFKALSDAMTNALESFKNIIITDKRN